MKNKQIDELTKALLWTGGLNIGIIGLFDYNILANVFGARPEILTLIYISIGISTIYSIAKHEL